MLRKIALFSALVAGLGTSVFADGENTEGNEWGNAIPILITDDGYFPFITYLNPGDRVAFVNATEQTQSIQARRFTGRWTSGTLQPGEEFYLDVTETTQLNFEDVATSTVVGQLSFDPAPLN